MRPLAYRLAIDAQLLRDGGLSDADRSSGPDQGSTPGRSSGHFMDVHPRFLRGLLVVWKLPTHPAERGRTTPFRGRPPGRSQLEGNHLEGAVLPLVVGLPHLALLLFPYIL